MVKSVKLKLSPSHSKRWLNCSGSAALVATLPESPSSKHAAEGTAAHEVAWLCLEQREDACQWVGEKIETREAVFKVTPNMAEAVQVYLDAVRGDLKDNGVGIKELAIEKKFVIKVGGREIPGTNDASFSSLLGSLHVYDYKHGAGMYVEVVENTQLMIYALGAMDSAGWVNNSVVMTIVQPRYTRDEVNPVRSWTITREELLKFKEELAAGVAKALKPKAPLCPGLWCASTFCPAFGVCPAVRQSALAVVPELPVIQFPEPAKMTPEQIIKVMDMSGLVASWAKAVKAYAERSAIDLGVSYPGYKVIQKWGNRAWVDEMMVENEFENEFGDAIYDKKLKSPAKMDKLVGKDRVKDLVAKKNNGLELVHDSAKGEPVEDAGSVFEKIK